MPDDTLPLKIQSSMTQNPSWMMRELVESSKFQTFPPRRIWIRLLLPKNPHPLGAKIGSKLKQFSNNPTVFNTISGKKCLPSPQHWRNSGIDVCAALCLQSLRFIQKNTQPTISRIITVRDMCAPESDSGSGGAPRSAENAPVDLPTAASAFLRTRG